LNKLTFDLGSGQSCSTVLGLPWAAQHNTWLLIELMPKGVVFYFIIFCFILFSFSTALGLQQLATHRCLMCAALQQEWAGGRLWGQGGQQASCYQA